MPHRLQRAQVGHHRNDVLVGEIGGGIAHEERQLTVVHHAGAKGPRKGLVADAADSGCRVGGEIACVARTERAHLEGETSLERAGLDLLEVRQVVGTVTLGAVRRPVHQVASPLDQSGVRARRQLRRQRARVCEPAVTRHGRVSHEPSDEDHENDGTSEQRLLHDDKFSRVQPPGATAPRAQRRDSGARAP